MEEAKIVPLQKAMRLLLYSLELESNLSIILAGATVKAGFPSPADDYVAGRIDLNTYFSSNPTSSFLVKVEGDSMVGAHIMPGDMAVVNKNRKARNGDIVLAYVNGEFTIKRLDNREDGAYLLAENPKYPPIRVTENDNGRIWGVVEGIARTM